MASFGFSRRICSSLTWATSRRAFEIFASAASRVWFTYCLLVLSLSAMADIEVPALVSDQTALCLGLSGDANEQLVFISRHVNS